MRVRPNALLAVLALAVPFGLAFLALPALPASAQEPSTREMNLLGWQEFAELMRSGVETVLSPTVCSPTDPTTWPRRRWPGSWRRA
jgi:hypothetical protein